MGGKALRHFLRVVAAGRCCRQSVQEVPSVLGEPSVASLKVLPLAGGGKPLTVLENAEGNAVLQPGGNRWLAFQSNESGEAQIYLTRFPSPGTKYQVSPAGGTQAIWSRDGKHLYYLDAISRMTVVDITADKDSVQFSPPRGLFPTTIRSSQPFMGYTVTRDGRFLVATTVQDTPDPITVVVNWDEELKK